MSEPIYFCQYCSNSFLSKNLYQEHLVKHKSKLITVNQSNSYSFKNCKNNSGNYLSSPNMGDNSNNNSLNTIEMMAENSLLHESGKPHKCEKCGKCFAKLNHLLSHMQSHLANKLYHCKYCYKVLAINY